MTVTGGQHGFTARIQHKGAKGKPLSPILKKLNTAIGGLRFKVEQAFGTMKRKFHLARASDLAPVSWSS